MSLEVPSHGITQRHGGAEHDKHGVKALSEVLRDIANTAAHPHHIKTGNADAESGQDIETAIPAMKSRRPLPDFRDELN